ncbi:MAG: hypothetical protein AAB545_03395 [Patescibacteria group bacterium]
MELDPKQIEDLFWKLPPELQEAITSAETATHIQQIGKVHGLHLDDLDVIFEEVGKVMLGLNKPENFGVTIRSRLGLADEKSRAVVRSIDDEIFQPIRKSLMEITEKEREETSPSIAPIIDPASSISYKISEAPPQTSPAISQTPTPSSFTSFTPLENTPQNTSSLRAEGTPHVEPMTEFTGPSIPIPEPKENSLPKTSEEISREEILNQVENPQDIPQKSPPSQSILTQGEKDTFAEKYPDLAGIYAPKSQIPETSKEVTESEETPPETKDETKKESPLPPPLVFTPVVDRISPSQTISTLAYAPKDASKNSSSPEPVGDPSLKTVQKTITKKHEIFLTPKDVPPVVPQKPAYLKADPYRENF